MDALMENELRELLKAVPRSYPAFVNGISAKLKGNVVDMKKAIDFIMKNPDYQTGEIIEYVDDDILKL